MVPSELTVRMGIGFIDAHAAANFQLRPSWIENAPAGVVLG
jgi:hypothetical protein